MKKIIFTLFIGLFLVGDCYGYDKQLEGDWISQDKNMECSLLIFGTQECFTEICLNIECINKQNRKRFSFPMFELINTTKNKTFFGDKNITFWEVERNGKNLTIFPQNIDKVKSHKYGFGNITIHENLGNYDFIDYSLVDKIINQFPKMKFRKQ